MSPSLKEVTSAWQKVEVTEYHAHIFSEISFMNALTISTASLLSDTYVLDTRPVGGQLTMLYRPGTNALWQEDFVISSRPS